MTNAEVRMKVSDIVRLFDIRHSTFEIGVDDLVRLPDENPSIGIILCKSKDRIIVEYALRYADKPIGVSEYHIVKKLPKALKGQLPTPEQIERLLSDVE
jgi:hypothetical protein